MKKNIRIASWVQPNKRLKDQYSTRAVFEHSKHNFSIEINDYPTDISDTETSNPLYTPNISIELPKGFIWQGNILELQEILLPLIKHL